jgi:hypothetical protein
MLAFPLAKDFLNLISYIFCNLVEKEIASQEIRDCGQCEHIFSGIHLLINVKSGSEKKGRTNTTVLLAHLET